MQLLSVLSAAALVFSQCGVAAPTPEDASVESVSKKCTSPLVRKEWRALTKKEQLSYIAAVKCLQAKPSKTSSVYTGAQSRYDDFQAVHIAMTERIHFVGQFLPWHRKFLAVYEAELRSTCGYTGAQPYWDWTKDAVSASAWVNSPVFDSSYGFGGNGEYLADISDLPVTSLAPGPLEPRTGGGCVLTGPFANHTVSMGPGNSLTYTPHCLRRDFITTLATKKLTQAEVNWESSASTFWLYTQHIEIANMSSDLSGITTHGGGHFSVGGTTGEMSDMYSSPGDPLFFLHHGKLDYEWNRWQHLAWATRKSEIAGPDTMWAYPYNYWGDVPYKNITLDFTLQYPNLASNVTIRDVMDITGGELCYVYA
ncbi:Di-copper centre-containing protein [Thozetella sp. PMI_491]|nr:Di-copper centre-containing protein [Thozetella sp. PMI_491]